MSFDYSNEFERQFHNQRWRNRFTLDTREPLERGRQRWIYRGFDHDTGQRVAIKLAPPGHFAYEYEQLTRIHRIHALEGIVPTPVAIGNDASWIAVSWIQGQTANHLCPSDFAAAIAQMPALIDAIENLHLGGYIHGDLKPSNLILLPNPGIIDFANAMAIGEPLTTHPHLAYSPDYSAERLKNAEGNADVDIDWYAMEQWWLKFASLLNNRLLEAWVPVQTRIIQHLKT